MKTLPVEKKVIMYMSNVALKVSRDELSSKDMKELKKRAVKLISEIDQSNSRLVKVDNLTSRYFNG